MNLVLLFGLGVGCVALLVCFELRLLLWVSVVDVVNSVVVYV